MRLFAIGDLHLPGGDDKPMNVFGSHWENHFERISKDWRERVSPEDTVLIPGDISWAMQLKDAVPDLQAIGALPGRKVILRGNHDYWWSSITQVREALPERMEAIQNDAADLDDCVVCGTRGWSFGTAANPLPQADEKILRRETQRLRMSLEAAVKLAEGRPIVVMTHYPPLLDNQRQTPFTEVLRDYPVRLAVYGHLHGSAIRSGFNGEWEGIRYRLVSCDALDFTLADCLPGDSGK